MAEVYYCIIRPLAEYQNS